MERKRFMTESDPPVPHVKAHGCAFAIGVFIFIVLTLMALLSTHLATGKLPGPNDNLGFAIIALVLWVVWLGVAVLLFRSARK
jgi:hypothetical protein